MKKPCKSMGFTQRASCRPYKNCYKHSGGSVTRKNRSSRRSKSRSSRRSSRKTKNDKNELNKPAFLYHSTSYSFTSHPEKGSPHGKINTINIKNNKGHERFEILDKKGKPIKVKNKALNEEKINEIVEGSRPGLIISV